MVCSGWTARLPAGAFAAWVKLLLEAKQFYRGGRVSLARFDAEWRRQKRIPLQSWNVMLKAAIEDGAVRVDDERLIIVNWDRYQRDPSNVARQRVYRDRQKQGEREADRDAKAADESTQPAVQDGMRTQACQQLADAISAQARKKASKMMVAEAAMVAVGWTGMQRKTARDRYGVDDIVVAARYTLHHNPVDPGGYLRRCLERGYHRGK